MRFSSALLLVSVCLVFTAGAVAQAAEQTPSGQLTVSFVPAQSPVQMALWVENAKGEYVRTLYVTRWEAKDGWKRNILPQ